MNYRQQASAAGIRTYQTGSPCRRGHTGPRYTSNGMCVECLKVHADTLRDQTKAVRISKNKELALEIVRCTIDIPLHYNNSGIVQTIQRILNAPDAEGFVTWLNHIDTQPLDASVLVSMFQWDGKKVNVDPAIYPYRNADDGRLLVQLRNAWYVGDEVMATLRGEMITCSRVWE